MRILVRIQKDGGQVENVFSVLGRSFLYRKHSFPSVSKGMFYGGIIKLFDKLTVKPKQPLLETLFLKKGPAAKVQQPSLNTLDSVSLKFLRESGGKIGVFFADTFGAYAKVLSLQTITHTCFRKKARVNDIN